MVCIDPETQLRIDRIAGVDHTVPIRIILGQRQETVRMGRRGPGVMLPNSVPFQASRQLRHITE